MVVQKAQASEGPSTRNEYFSWFWLQGVEEGTTMKEMIIIRMLENGFWEIRVVMRKSRTELIERGKVCKI